MVSAAKVIVFFGKPFRFRWFSVLPFILTGRRAGNGVEKKKSLSATQRKGFSYLLSFFFRNLCLLGAIDTLLFDACFLTGELAQVVEFGAANLTNLVYLDAFDVR